MFEGKMTGLISYIFLCFVGLFGLSLHCVYSAAIPALMAEDAEFWRREGEERLRRMLASNENTNVAKNVIMFLGDGMSVGTITAARILKGQNNNKTGEETVLSFENFTSTGMAKTYNVDRTTPDSAATATSLMTGVKTNFRLVGVDSSVTLDDCASMKGGELETILDWSMTQGKSTGVVTTTRVTHATPAATYAKSASRFWEGDANLPPDMNGDCKDIAYQLVMNKSDISVVMGGGRYYFLPNNATDPQTGKMNSKEYGRRDGRDLTQEWLDIQADNNRQCHYVWNRTQMMSTDGDCLLGLFNPDHMSFELDRKETDEPSLSEMTEKAIQILSKNEKGFFLLVEGGRIDHAHHDGMAKRALYETLAMEEAVEKTLQMTNEEDTLIVVTSDHSHTMVISGYPSRGNPILGIDDYFDNSDAYSSTADRMPMTTILYGNGPGYGRENLTNKDVYDNNYRQQSAVNISSETHNGEDVAVFARGPMAHLLTGVYEQSYINHVMAYASCVGSNQNHCNKRVITTASPCHSNKDRLNSSMWLPILILGLIASRCLNV